MAQGSVSVKLPQIGQKCTCCFPLKIATANSLGLRKIGDCTTQPDNAATQGKVAKIIHLIEVTEA